LWHYDWYGRVSCGFSLFTGLHLIWPFLVT
jgi:hypothetical protein